MMRAWADKLVRLSAGAGLVLLLAAEQKVCPWLLHPPAKARVGGGQTQPAHPARADQGPAERTAAPQRPKPEPLSLISALPQALPARWSWSADGAIWQELSGHRDGVVVCGPLRPSPAPSTQGTPANFPSWRLLDGQPPVVRAAEPRQAAGRIADPAIATLLLRTGPPA